MTGETVPEKAQVPKSKARRQRAVSVRNQLWMSAQTSKHGEASDATDFAVLHSRLSCLEYLLMDLHWMSVGQWRYSVLKSEQITAKEKQVMGNIQPFEKAKPKPRIQSFEKAVPVPQVIVQEQKPAEPPAPTEAPKEETPAVDAPPSEGVRQAAEAQFDRAVTKPATSVMAEPAHKIANIERAFLFSSESVNEGHPDNLRDQVSDADLNTCLTEDPKSKVTCETATKNELDDAPAAATNPIALGSIVRIKGLRKRSDLNGMQAKVLTFDAGSSRFECQLACATPATRTICCKLENFTLLSQSAEVSSEIPKDDADNTRDIVVCSKEELSADDVQFYFESCFGDVQDVKPNPDETEEWIVTFANSDAAVSALHIMTHQILRDYDGKLVAAVCHSLCTFA